MSKPQLRRTGILAGLILLAGVVELVGPSHDSALNARSTIRKSTGIQEALGPGLAFPEFSPVRAVGPIGLTVSDLDRAVKFFTEVLSFVEVHEVEVLGEEWERLSGVFGARVRIARLRLGDETIELTEYMTPKGRPIPIDSRSNDRWFQHIAIVVRDMDEAYAHLRAHGVDHASTAPQRLPDWNPNAGGIEAFYFKDPDGHILELIHFPPGKGDPRWHGPTDRLFRGIDHTAIVVGDTETSLRLYRDALGLVIAGESLNYGTEQEHLNNVFGARLQITALRAPEGPGIELLEYLAPTDGRPYPVETHANDLIHWQTTLVASDLNVFLPNLTRIGYRLVSSGVVEFGSSAAGLRTSHGFHTAVIIRDVDGHALRLVDPGIDAGLALLCMKCPANAVLGLSRGTSPAAVGSHSRSVGLRGLLLAPSHTTRTR